MKGYGAQVLFPGHVEILLEKENDSKGVAVLTAASPERSSLARGEDSGRGAPSAV